MKRTLFAVLAITVVGCSNGNNGGNDMGVTGSDMAAPGGSMTIAMARQGNVTGPITVTAVVIAINGAAPDAKEWYIQDPAGGAYSGVSVYCNKTAKSNPCPMTINVPALHDLVQVTGKLSTFKGKVELQPTAQMTMMAGATPPAPATAMAANIGPASTDASLRGQLVKLTGTLPVDNVTPSALHDSRCNGEGGTMCTGCHPPTYSGFQINDGASHEVLVDNVFYTNEHLASSPECVAMGGAGMQVSVGKTFTMLTGILDIDPYAAGSNIVVVEPTADSDYTLQ